MSRTQIQESVAPFTTAFEQRQAALAGRGGAALHETRKRAMARLVELGFPTVKHEEWKYTSLVPVTDVEWKHVSAPQPVPAPSELAPSLFGEEVAARLVFVNGVYCPEVSRVEGLPAGIFAGPLSEALEAELPWVRQHLTRHLAVEAHPFAALSTAFIAEGAAIHVPRGANLEQPVHLLYLSSGSEGAVAAHPRNLVVVEEGGAATLVEHYATLGVGPTLTNTATEVFCGENAIVDHYKVQEEGPEARHAGLLAACQERAGNYTHHSISLGAAWARHDLATRLAGEGGQALLHGLYVLSGEQLCDHHTRIEHAAPHCSSFELYKGILDARSRAVFNGKIYVHREAQKTDSKQSNRNLLLSDEALVNTKPQLEIFADDVKCTHGATIGHLDEEAFFYMRSRGIGRQESRTLLIYAFASEVVDRIRVEPLRRHLLRALVARLPNGHVIKEVV